MTLFQFFLLLALAPLALALWLTAYVLVRGIVITRRAAKVEARRVPPGTN